MNNRTHSRRQFLAKAATGPGLIPFANDLKQFDPTSPLRFQKKNADGWFKADLRRGWIARDRVLFIKPKAMQGL